MRAGFGVAVLAGTAVLAVYPGAGSGCSGSLPCRRALACQRCHQGPGYGWALPVVRVLAPHRVRVCSQPFYGCSFGGDARFPPARAAANRALSSGG